MASHPNVNKTKSATVAAGTVDTVTFANNIGAVTFISLSTTGAVMWVRPDDTDPTVKGDDCYPVLAGATLDLPTDSPVDTVKLTASTDCDYTVAGY